MAWFVYLARCADGTLYTGDHHRSRPAGRGPQPGPGRALTPGAGGRCGWCTWSRPLTAGRALRRELAIKRMTGPEKEAMMGRGRGRAESGVQAEDFGVFGRGIRFLRRLARNNRREWFERHRPDYEMAVRDPMRALVEEMDVRLARLGAGAHGGPSPLGLPDPPGRPLLPPTSHPTRPTPPCQFYHRDAGRRPGQDAVGGGAGLYFQLADGDASSRWGGASGCPARPRSTEECRDHAIAIAARGAGAIARLALVRRRVSGSTRRRCSSGCPGASRAAARGAMAPLPIL